MFELKYVYFFERMPWWDPKRKLITGQYILQWTTHRHYSFFLPYFLVISVLGKWGKRSTKIARFLRLSRKLLVYVFIIGKLSLK